MGKMGSVGWGKERCGHRSNISNKKLRAGIYHPPPHTPQKNTYSYLKIIRISKMTTVVSIDSIIIQVDTEPVSDPRMC